MSFETKHGIAAARERTRPQQEKSGAGARSIRLADFNGVRGFGHILDQQIGSQGVFDFALGDLYLLATLARRADVDPVLALPGEHGVLFGRRGWILLLRGLQVILAGRFRWSGVDHVQLVLEREDQAPRIDELHCLAAVQDMIEFEQIHADCAPQDKPQAWEGIDLGCSPTPDCPAQMVNWFDAVLYCNWLSRRAGRQPCYRRDGLHTIQDYQGNGLQRDVWRCDFTVNGYRLPTEAEWEFASRSASRTSYCFGEGTPRLHEYAWMLSNANGRTWPGGLKLPNAWGFFDLHGNVWEWCWDYEGKYPGEAATDPTGPDSGQVRMLRGGAAGVGALGCRSAFRYSHRPDYRSTTFGFRVCCGE